MLSSFCNFLEASGSGYTEVVKNEEADSVSFVGMDGEVNTIQFSGDKVIATNYSSSIVFLQWAKKLKEESKSPFVVLHSGYDEKDDSSTITVADKKKIEKVTSLDELSGLFNWAKEKNLEMSSTTGPEPEDNCILLEEKTFGTGVKIWIDTEKNQCNILPVLKEGKGYKYRKLLEAIKWSLINSDLPFRILKKQIVKIKE